MSSPELNSPQTGIGATSAEMTSSSPPTSAKLVPTPIIEAPVAQLGSTSEQIAEGIQLAVCSILVVVWAIVGFVFWIPFLTRAIAAYTVAVLGATFTGSSLYSAQRGLDTAVRFWFGGFQAVLAARLAIHSKQNPFATVPAPMISGMLEALFHHLLFTLLFWAIAAALFVVPWHT